MTNVHRIAGTVLGGATYDISFAYDTAGRRILRKGIGASDSLRQRTRYFFQGLTEAIRKVSVAGAHSDDAFGRTVLFNCESTPSGWTGSTVSKVSDSTRRSNVYQTSGSSRHGSTWYLCGDGEAITGKRTFSVWLKAGGSNSSSFTINFLTNNICRALTYVNTTGSPYYTGLDPEEGGTGDEEGYIQLGGTSQAFTSNWTRLERNIQADIDAMWPGETLVEVIGVSINRGSSSTISMDDLSFSNSLTVEHDTLGPGSIGHILRHRTINTSTYAATDSWYHYDQVGSVMAESNSSGALSTQDWQDAYGNTQASFTTGLIGGTQSGFHHNTKEYDGDVGLVYMYQRWYCPETGTFLSKAPVDREDEEPYSFVEADPVSEVDSEGECGAAAALPAATATGGGLAAAAGAAAAGAAIVGAGAAGVWIGKKIDAATGASTAIGDAIGNWIHPKPIPIPEIVPKVVPKEHTKGARPSTNDKHTKPRSGKKQPPGYKGNPNKNRPQDRPETGDSYPVKPKGKPKGYDT